MSKQSISPKQYTAFVDFLEKSSGIILSDNKHYLVTSRLSRLMENSGISDFSDLLERQHRDRRLREQIVDAMTTNETSWFRDQYPFAALKNTIFPKLAHHKKSAIRIWSAACSTGQEPYSISMCFEEYIRNSPVGFPRLEIIATDISPSALDKAKTGRYEELTLGRGLSKHRWERFFEHKVSDWEVKQEIRDRISFMNLNLTQGFASLGKFDIIFCRNVLIYFSTALKQDVLARIANALNPGGYLLLGGSESMANYSNAFQMIRNDLTVLYKLKSRES